MKRMAASLAAAAMSLSVVSLAASPAEAATYSMHTASIVLNGKKFVSPPEFAYQGTTYMPIYYVDDVFKTLGFTDTFDGSTHPKVWKLTTPALDKLQLSLNAHSGNINLYVNGQLCEQEIPSIAAEPPGGKQATTFVPIWYIQQIFKQLGIVDQWNGTVRKWTLTSKYSAYNKAGDKLGTYQTLQAAENALAKYSGGDVENSNGQVIYTQPSFSNVDLRFPAPSQLTAAAIDQILGSHSSPLQGLGATIIEAQQTYSVDANYLVSHAVEESTWGTSQIALNNNDLYGYGATDQSNGAAAGMFPSEAYAILFQAFEVRNNYLTPDASNWGGAPTLNGMHKNYASDPNWATNIENVMEQFALDTNTTVKNYVQYDPNASKPVPQPASSTEPVYWLNGAAGTTQAPSTYYSGTPVFSDSDTGANELYARPLQVVPGQPYESGPDVKELQLALNQMGANLTVDGIFGPDTQTAVETYLDASGVVTDEDWPKVLEELQSPGPQILPAGQNVQIDQVKMGMVGGDVAEWVHIQDPVDNVAGWTPASAVQWSNVYRLGVDDPTNPSEVNIPVKAPSDPSNQIATLRAGDTIVAQSTQASGGYYTIQFANPSSMTSDSEPQMETGLVSASSVSLDNWASFH
ncbi:glucosaminidase domain-containing protein [Alicyclobacillus cycloheptanicus]|uniref:Beta-N-acetylglucosaminidase/peptidoglycan hydrolase-like protein with peptidoglycan-binding domain n=2 Tax=Alicyclobacillus cycloheptanicus TaxID=1457 RepID=A0ABT9XE63_9BACL|nr:beta-N-acetylglucosaminidase/peptidoglycan hydrolase-like protein with peptidoglycan-binding domain [Alicyclobacillus cycloheptanicus]WDM01270.1 glucosaminidase domain-containing protein [Alicyclobacillus cycloheptanicus]